jgi:transposase
VVRRKRGNRRLVCSGCGRKLLEAHEGTEREVRDPPWGEFRVTVAIALSRVRCANYWSQDRTSRPASEQGSVQQVL